MTQKAYCHRLVAKTATEMANVLFDEMMRDNRRWALWRRLCPEATPEEIRKRWVSVAWPRLVPQARATLAEMLNRPLAEGLKRDIHDALVLDQSLRQTRPPL